MYILRSVIFFSFLLLNTILNAITIDRPLAKIEDEYITVFDLSIGRDFFYKDKSFTDEDIIKKIILIKAVIKEYGKEYKSSKGLNIINFKEKLIEDYGGLENLRKQLSIYGITFEQFNKYIKEYLFFNKIRENVLLSRVIVRFDEIEKYYYKVYIPNQRKLNLNIKPLTEVAGIIERRIKMERVTKLEKFWIKEILSHYDVIYYE